jgi:gluconate 2-dehydrogenase gamma chain
MDGGLQTRRTFLAGSSAATIGWLALPWLASMASCARDDARRGSGFSHLSAREARTLRAFAAQIIPSTDDSPGAEEAGAVYFVDRALAMPLFADVAPLGRAALADLDTRARAIDPDGSFASLGGAEQASILQRVEREATFAAARSLVVIGTFADPSYGGNRDGIGWTMLGIDHRPSYVAPFGWYDSPGETRRTMPAA